MNTMPLIIIAGIVCIIALVTTIYIAFRPNDRNYQKNTKSRWILLTWIYIITFVPALIFTVVYFVIR
ncbi:hypothetical protein [Evansella tamaricis]|uniref:Cardiolipin synthase N-terminal domain-containing protein n=1 Tax=Evansella tamaricis TaxID=2069301 RepID=A0ABS6JB70_9BACI|nr:hypothetical protein [Evansella tamaricis]MBU9710926.1 hypothetical protein [Evansella tamaricis]